MLDFMRRSDSRVFQRVDRVVIVAAILSLAGTLTFLMATHHGIGLSPDSVAYIRGARSILAGDGFGYFTVSGNYQPITHHAPLYSYLLSAVSLLEIEPMEGARLVNVLLFGANIFLTGIILLSLTADRGSSRPWIPIYGSFMIATSIPMLEIHTMAWSEALFLFLALAGLVLLGFCLDHPSRSFLVTSGVLIGLACLTRYAGVALLAAGLIGILLFSRQMLKKKISNAIIFGMLGGLPLALLLLRNLLSAGTATNREIFFHPISREQIWQLLTTLSSWLLINESFPTLGKVAGLLSIPVILAIMILVRHKREDTTYRQTIRAWLDGIPGFIKLTGLFVPIYMGFLFVSLSFFDANTPLDNRILSPIFVSLMFLFLFILGEFFYTSRRTRYPEIALYGIGAFVMIAYGVSAIHFVSNSYLNGIGFNSVVWRNSTTVAEVNRLPQGILIYSNAPEIVYVHSGRSALSLPRKYETANRRFNAAYDADLALLGDQIEKNHAKIVYFKAVQRASLPSESELIDKLPISVLVQGMDGTIYGIDSPGN